MFSTLKLLFKAFYIRYKGRPAALKKAVRKADRLCRKKNKRYRVYFIGHRYQALSRPDIQHRKHAGLWNRNVNVTKMQPMCFYDTLTGIQPAGTEVLTAKKLAANG